MSQTCVKGLILCSNTTIDKRNIRKRYHNLFQHSAGFFHPTNTGNNISTPDSPWTSCVCPVTRRVKILFAAAIFKYLRIRKSHGRLGIANTKLMGQVWSGHLGAASAIEKKSATRLAFESKIFVRGSRWCPQFGGRLCKVTEIDFDKNSIEIATVRWKNCYRTLFRTKLSSVPI